MISVPKELRCGHPKSMTKGVCKRAALLDGKGKPQLYDIPDDYELPRLRHAGNPPLPRPQAQLCMQHYRKILAHTNGMKLMGASHEAQCAACLHPRCKWVFQQWVQWRFSTGMVLTELNITHKCFYKHVDYFKLDDKRAAKDMRKRYYAEIAEKGLAAGDHSVATGLKAMEGLAKEIGDRAPEEINHNVKGLIGTVDLSTLSAGQLAEALTQLTAELEKLPSPPQNALPEGISDDNVIDIPKSAVKVVKNANH